jgi:uncharacterized cupin superfamily protein
MVHKPQSHRAIHKFDSEHVNAQEYFLPADKLLAGNPKQSVWNHYQDTTQKFSAGEWFSEVGKWKISYTEEEYCQILEGVSVITDNDGNSITLSTGDNFVVPSGFVGTWEVIEPTRKIYVVYEPNA